MVVGTYSRLVGKRVRIHAMREPTRGHSVGTGSCAEYWEKAVASSAPALEVQSRLPAKDLDYLDEMRSWWVEAGTMGRDLHADWEMWD